MFDGTLFHVKHRPESLPNVSRETLDRLALYARLVRQWSGTVNLVGKRDLLLLETRHIQDCLQLLPLVPSTANVLLDLGSGAGLPGLVLAIAAKKHFHLVESDQRKASFLRETARSCGAAVTVHACRIESMGSLSADVVTARALAPLPALLRLAAPHLVQGGICLFPKGRTVTAELTQACTEWHMQVRRWPSQTDPDATILQLSEIALHAGPEHRAGT